MANFQPTVKGSDMCPEMKAEAIAIAQEALSCCGVGKGSNENETAAMIQRAMSLKYSGKWYVVVGRDFGSHVVSNAETYLYVFMGPKNILIYSIGTEADAYERIRYEASSMLRVDGKIDEADQLEHEMAITLSLLQDVEDAEKARIKREAECHHFEKLNEWVVKERDFHFKKDIQADVKMDVEFRQILQHLYATSPLAYREFLEDYGDLIAKHRYPMMLPRNVAGQHHAV